MESFTGFLVFIFLCVLIALIAKKKGRSPLIFFIATALPAIPLVILISLGTQGNGTMMGWGAFICPLIGFVIVIMTENSEQMAIKVGEYGDLKKCPYCAESIRKEAVKCKHCGSSINVSA